MPEIDTVLFLRPTESATVFLQQLGRGLRLAEDKPCLTVLDFIGGQHDQLPFDLRYRALTGVSAGRLSARSSMASLRCPPAATSSSTVRSAGWCSKILGRRSARIRRRSWRSSAAWLRRAWPSSSARRGSTSKISIGASRGGWAGLRREAGVESRLAQDPRDDKSLASAISRMLHIDDPERIAFLRDLLSKERPPRWDALDARRRRLLGMLHATIDSSLPLSALPRNLTRLWTTLRRDELLEVADVLSARLHRLTPVLSGQTTYRSICTLATPRMKSLRRTAWRSLGRGWRECAGRPRTRLTSSS